jgi:hypothetical protein
MRREKKKLWDKPRSAPVALSVPRPAVNTALYRLKRAVGSAMKCCMSHGMRYSIRHKPTRQCRGYLKWVYLVGSGADVWLVQALHLGCVSALFSPRGGGASALPRPRRAGEVVRERISA